MRARLAPSRLDWACAAPVASERETLGRYLSAVEATNTETAAKLEATVALSLSPVKRMRRVILPQAIPEMVPPFGNLLVQMLKGSSLLFLIGITELTFEVQQLRFEIGSLTAFTIALVVYFFLAQAFLAVMRVWERRASARVGRVRAKATPESAVVHAPSGGAGAGGAL